MSWFEEIGFEQNPFFIKPNANVVGLDSLVSELVTKVNQGNICILTGAYGTGKTSLLKLLIQVFGGRRRVIYYSCNRRDGFIDFDKLLKGRSLYNRLLGTKAKHMILLLDEVDKLNIREKDVLVKYFKGGFFKSIVLSAKAKLEMDLNGFLESGARRNLYKLGTISEKDAVKIIRSRIGNHSILSDKLIILIWKKNSNPRTFLQNCEDVCRHAVENGRKNVEKTDLVVI